MKKILLFGAQGMLGAEIFNVAQARENIEIVPLSRFNCDITNEKSVQETIAQFNPDVVINAAAYTNVDRCEEEKWADIARSVNVDAPGYLAKACDAKGIEFYHFSTDYVFSGDKGQSFTESDTPNPCNVYGQIKLEGEQKALEYKGTKICRVAWLAGDCGANFVHKMVHFSKTRPSISLVEEYGNPTFVHDVAVQLFDLIKNPQKEKIFHMVSNGDASRMELVQEIQKYLNLSTERNLVLPEYFGLTATRPISSVLQNTLLPAQKSWQENLHSFLSLEKEKLDKKRVVQAKKDAAKAKYQALRTKEMKEKNATN